MSSIQVTTNFRDSNGSDLGTKLVTKDYLISVYPEIGSQIGIPPELWTWGNGSNGRLGNASTTSTNSTPITTFAGGTNWKQVSSGGSITVAIKTDGTLWIWGSGSNGGLGNASITGVNSTPVTTFAGGNNWKQVSSGDSHTAAIKTDGTLWIWGSSADGKLGNGLLLNFTRSTPNTTFAGGTNWKQVSSGGSHTAAIKTDGTLWLWGSDFNSQLGTNFSFKISTPVTTFAGGTNWADTATAEPEDLYTLSAGDSHTAAIKTDGTLWTWGSPANGALGGEGSNPFTPVTTFAGGTNWKQVSVGTFLHTAAIKTDGTLWIWGDAGSGKLGNATISGSKDTPITTFAGETNWKQVSSGDAHTAAIKTDGTLWIWGNVTSGRLGNGATTGSISTPVTTFAGGTNWKQVSSGGYHTAAIKTDGTLWVWGNGNGGRLGNADTTNRSTPITTFAGGTNWKQVSVANFNTAAIKTDGTLWTWGQGSQGQLGNAQTSNVSTPITTFAGGTNWKQVSAGRIHTAAIKTDETLWTWGNGTNAQLGNAQTSTVSTPITTFAGGTDWKQVSAAEFHTCALKGNQVFIFGNGSGGLLGIGNIAIYKSTPVTTFAGETNWKQVSAGTSHTAAIKTDGTLWTWGNGTSGRLGNAVTTNAITPVTTFAGGTNWKQVSSGDAHTAAIKTDGTLWTWGNGTNAQLGNRFTLPTSTPVTTFAGGTNWKQVSTESIHTAAIKTDGTLWLWGNPNGGRLGNALSTGSTSTPVTTFAGGTNWKQVSTGGGHTSAIQSVDF